LTATGWPEVALGDACARITDGAHWSPPSVSVGKPMASVKDLSEYGISIETCRLVAQQDYDRLVAEGCRPQPGDVLIAKDGATALDTVCVVTESVDVVLLSSIAILRPDRDVLLPLFLRYMLTAPRVRDYMKGAFTSGAAIPRVVLKDFKKVRVAAPPLRTQLKIVAVLSAYDDLIENNNRRVKLLEEMAQRTYREWFVDFRYPGRENIPLVDSELGPIPEGWKVVRLGSVADNFDRKRKPLSGMVRALRPGHYPYYGAAKIFDFIDDYIFDGTYLLIAEDGSVITPEGMAVLQYVSGKFWANNHTHVLQGTTLSTEHLYLLLADLPISGYITGAAQPKITQANINRIPCVVPRNEVAAAFNAIVRPLFQAKKILESHAGTLRASRDLLLPRLISGEIDVTDLDIASPDIVA
jgi:type I restriction enzyme S subunit